MPVTAIKEIIKMLENPSLIKIKEEEKEIEKTEDLEKYLTGYGSKGFTLVFRAPEEEEVIFGSDCCNILNKKEAIFKTFISK